MTARPPSSPCRIPVPGCTGAVSSGLAWSAPRVRSRPGAELRCLLRAVFLLWRRAPTHLARTSCPAPWSASAIPVYSPRRVVSTKCCAMSIARTVFDEMCSTFCGNTSLRFASYVLYRAPSRRASWALGCSCAMGGAQPDAQRAHLRADSPLQSSWELASDHEYMQKLLTAEAIADVT
ncbi:hypothetical protein EJB05_39285, partial [Eragrostis curvula]